MPARRGVDERPPARHAEGDHRRLHERRARIHDPHVVRGEQRCRDQASTAPAEARHPRAQRRDGEHACQHRDEPGLPEPDAKRLERRVFERGEHRRDVHRVPVVAVDRPRAPQGLVAGVVRPRALVVPDDTDRRFPRRVGEREGAAQQRRDGQDEQQQPGVGARGQVANALRQADVDGRAVDLRGHGHPRRFQMAKLPTSAARS